MLRVARSASLLAGVLALQLVVMSDGVVCGASARAAARGGDSMGAMDKGAMDKGTMDKGTSGRTSHPEKAPCAPGGVPTTCKSLLPCAPAFIAPAATVSGPRQAHSTREVALVERAPSSYARAPEPPPPRA